MTELYLDYEESSYGGEVINPEDRWSDRTEEVTEFYPKDLYLDRNKAGIRWAETIEAPFEVERGDIVHLVIVRYGSGDTFGHSSGHWAIMGLTKDEKVASELARRINTDEYDGTEEGVAGYYVGWAPWRGYFESLESCDVHTFEVK